MKFKNIRRWILVPELDGLLFFAQRLDELLWSFTLDTHKPMALNAPFLCKEALSLIADIENELIEEANLKHVLEELIWSVQNDPIAKSLLDLPIEHYVPVSDGVRLNELTIKLEALSRTLEPLRYLNRCCDHIASQVRSIEKKKIDFSTKTLVTTLVNLGVSKESLYQHTQEFFFALNGPSIDEVSLIDEFLKKIYPYRHEFTVYFIVQDLVRSVEESMEAFDIELLEKLPDDIIELAISQNFLPDEGETYVSVGPFFGYDIGSAQEQAANLLDKLSDLFTLFYHKRKITWHPRAIVKQCCRDFPALVTLTAGAMQKPFDMPPEKASRELRRLINNLALQGSSRDRFNRVADLHGTSVATEVVENQLVTLWTALETLVPSRTGSSKISNVLDSMIPFLMTSYVRRIVQRFSHDLVVWRRWRAKHVLSLVPDILGPDTLHRTAALLSVESNKNVRDELYKELQDFHLLRFRAFQLSEMLKSPQSVKSALVLHEKKLRWQIRRIYRTRNLIVHSGTSPSYIHGLVENAHEYIDQVIFDVMKLSCGDYQARTLSQAFELADIKYKKFMNRLSELESFSATNCLFLCDDFDTITESMPWGHEIESDGCSA